MRELSVWNGQLFHSFNLCVCACVCVFVYFKGEHAHVMDKQYHIIEILKSILFNSFPFKNQQRSVKKIKCSLHFLQLSALPYGACIKVKEDLGGGWGAGGGGML